MTELHYAEARRIVESWPPWKRNIGHRLDADMENKMSEEVKIHRAYDVWEAVNKNPACACDELVSLSDHARLIQQALANANEQIAQLQSTIRTQIDINDGQAKRVKQLEAGCQDDTSQCPIIGERDQLRGRIAELEEHEQQTHGQLAPILGADDSLQAGALKLRDRVKELEGACYVSREWIENRVGTYGAVMEVLSKALNPK